MDTNSFTAPSTTAEVRPMSKTTATVNILSYLLLFLATQLVAGVAMIIWVVQIKGTTTWENIGSLSMEAHAVEMGISLFITELIALGLLVALRVLSRQNIRRTTPLSQGGWAMASILLLAQGLSYIAAFLELPDGGMTATFMGMRDSVFCLLGLMVIGPIFEEVLLREGIQQTLLKAGMKVGLAIGLTALLFGVIHGNWYQGFAAALSGIYLGIFRERSGTLLLPIAAHILNNTMGVVQLHYPEVFDIEKYHDLSPAVLLSVGTLFVAFSLVCLWRFLCSHKRPLA